VPQCDKESTYKQWVQQKLNNLRLKEQLAAEMLTDRAIQRLKLNPRIVVWKDAVVDVARAEILQDVQGLIQKKEHPYHFIPHRLLTHTDAMDMIRTHMVCMYYCIMACHGHVCGT